MKHRGIRIAILCVMSVLLALAPLGCAEENVDGGLFAIFYDDRLLSLACKLTDDTLGTYNSDILKELAQIGTKVEVVDLETKKSYTGTLLKSTKPLALIKCDEALDGEGLTYPANLKDGETCEGVGYMMKEDTIAPGRITVKRPSGSSMEGTYEGGKLLAGSPIYLEQDGEILTLGFAGDDSSSYVDLSAVFKKVRQASDGKQDGGGQTSGGQTSGGQTSGGQTSGGQTSGGQTSGGQTSGGQTSGGQTSGGQTSGGQTSGGQTSGGQTSGGQTSGGQTSGGQTGGGQTSGGQTSGGQTSGGRTSGGQVNDGTNYVKWLVYLLAGCAVLTLIILANTRRGKKDEPEAQPAKPEANVTMPLMDDENVTVPDDPRYRGGASGFVMLECTNGALRGASFPIRGRVVIGRDPSRCVIVYPRDEKGVSAVHCAVEPVADDAVLVTDLGSSYGTLAGSKPLTSGMSARVRAGERIVLGGSGNEFQVRTR